MSQPHNSKIMHRRTHQNQSQKTHFIHLFLASTPSTPPYCTSSPYLHIYLPSLPPWFPSSLPLDLIPLTSTHSTPPTDPLHPGLAPAAVLVPADPALPSAPHTPQVHSDTRPAKNDYNPYSGSAAAPAAVAAAHILVEA